MGGVGEMKNVRSFLGLDAGMVGCVRRLEINDKYYNLEAAVHGGDIMAGRDIGEWSDPGEGGGFSEQSGYSRYYSPFLFAFAVHCLSSYVIRIFLFSYYKDETLLNIFQRNK